MSERPGRAVTDRQLHRSAAWTRPRQSGRSWRRVPAQGMEPASQNFILAKLRSQEAGSPSIRGSSLWSRNDLAEPDP